MLDWQKHKNLRLFIRIICVILIVTFLCYDLSWAGATEVLSFNNLASLSRSPFVPPTLKYLSVNEANPHNYFNFLLDKGQVSFTDKGTLNKEAGQLINYFFLGITLPDNVFWVNLKPAESDHITSEQLSRTDLGRTLLEQDFRLKRDVSQYLNPQNHIGRQFWEKLYSTLGKDKVKKASITTSNRVWIVPAEAVVVETEDGALLAKSSLKVLLESEYAALKLTKQQPLSEPSSGNSDSLKVLTEQLMKEIVIPAITKDVNESQNYAPLRQIYHSLILAQWFKRKHKNANSAYAQAINKGYLKGLESRLPWEKQQIWQDYLNSYSQGEYKIQDTIFGLKRMYFSGGVLFDLGTASAPLTIISQKELPEALKQNPDLLNPDLLKDSLVVLTERQGDQKNLQAQPLVQDIKIVSEKPELQESRSAGEASSPLGSIFNNSAAIFKGITKSFNWIIKRFTKNEVRPLENIGIHRPQGQIEQELSDQPRIINTPLRIQPEHDHDLSFTLRQELESSIQELNNFIAQGSRDTLARSFRPVGPAELPLPIPLSMLNQYVSDRDKIVHILNNMQRMMDGTDEKVLRDFERAIDNARDRVTEQALAQFDELADDQIYSLLTNGYLQELQREFQRIIENQIQHMVRFHAPSFEEQNLYVSEEINERYPRLPRYLKWLLTNNPQFENDPLVRDWLDTIQTRMSRIPAFPEMIREYSKRALNKSLYLNPELAMRVILYLSRGEDLGSLSEEQARSKIQQELARNLPEDVVITDISIEEEEAGILELPQAPQPRSLPAPETEKTDTLKAKLKSLIEDYQRFLVKFNEQEALVRKAESDLTELNEGLEEAKRQNDKVIISALKPAIEGLSSKLRRAKEAFSRLEQEKTRYEEQINQIRKESGETGGTVLYSIDPLSLAVWSAFAVIIGIPLYITKKILNKWYSTTAGKTFGIMASLSATTLGYYAYYMSFTPEIQEVFTDFSHADWLRLSTFFIIWPIAIIAGIFGGKVGKGISHEGLYWKASSEFKKGNIDEALSLINEAIRLNPKNTADYILLAECQRKKKRFDEAVASYKKTLEIEPSNSATHNNLGVVYVEKGDDTKAIESYKRSLELNANDPIVLANLGRVLHKKGQLLEAVRVFQRSQEIKPDLSVIEELNRVLQQTGRIEKLREPDSLPYFKTRQESVPSRSEWIRSFYSDFDEWGGGAVFLGLLSAGAFLYGAYDYNWWQLGTEQATTTTKWIVWLSAGISGTLLAIGLPIIIGKVVDVFKTIWRFFKYPLDYRKLEIVNKKPSDELSDNDLKAVAPIYARMSKEYLEQIFRSWMEAGHEEKVARLFKFGNWKSEKIRIYGDIGEYRKVSRQASTKFANTAQEQKAVFDNIDREKEKLTQKGIQNAVGLMKDILLQITEHSRSRDEFWHWLSLVVGLPKNILEQGSRQVLTVFTDLREFDRAQEESLNKFGAFNQDAAAKVKAPINSLVQKLERDGLNYPGILKKALAEINKASRNLDEFLFWVNEVMHFDKQLWSSGGFLGLLLNLIAYARVKEEASNKLCRNPEETSSLFQVVDSLGEELKIKQVSGDLSMLKDVIPRITEVSRNLTEFFEYITILKAFDKNMWRGTQSVLQAFNNHVAYKQARENTVAKFAQDDSTRQKFLSDIDKLRNQLVQKGFPQASDLLKDILPELTKTCRSKEEFVYWLGELVGLNTSVWRSGAQAVINNFNDLAGFKQAKEMALDKFCANQQEKDDLARTINSLKAKLEEKMPSSAGLIKDVILEILKDIDSLSDQPYRKTDFIWWLDMCVNFEAATWHAGVKQVLAGYQELKDYIKQRRELSVRFATNPEEQQRLTAVWDNLDKAVNLTRLASISLLKNTLGKIADFAVNPREFVLWVGTLSELNNEVLEVFCRDIAIAFEYYKDKGKTRDFNHLPYVLNQYHKAYHQTVLITPNLLDILTEPSIDIDKRIEKASQYIIEQKIVKLGAPSNLVGLKDAVSFEHLLAITGESGFSSMLNYHWQEESSSSDDYGTSYYDTSNRPIRQIVHKMGRDGMYSYWESQRPPYYQQFLEETRGLVPSFNRPGEKFRVAYDDRVVTWSKEEESQVMPVTDNIQALKQLIQYLRMEWPNLYENFIEPKRELIKGRPLEEFVTSDTATKMAQQLLGKVQNWKFSDQQRALFMIKIMEIFAFQETADLRVRINGVTDEFNRSRLVSQYWERVLELTLKNKWLQEKSKFYQNTARIIKQKIAILNEKLGNGGEGILQFYLSGKTMADFFKGSISSDCTAYGGVKFQDSLGTITDPAFFLFKVIEKGKWVGNIYSLACKTKDNKLALFVDWFKITKDHPLSSKDNSWDNRRKQFMKTFFEQFKLYLASEGFDYLIISPTTAESGYTLYKFTQEQAKSEAKKDNPETISLKKIGNIEHLREGSLPVEYVQNFGGNLNGSFRSVSGYQIALDKTTPQVIQQRQTELDYVDKLLGEMSTEETRLLALVKEKQTELNQINQKGREAANTGKSALAVALMNASEQKKAEMQKIEYELGELRAKVQEKRLETGRLREGLGMFKSGSSQGSAFASSPVGKTLILTSIIGVSNLFLSQPTQAQDISSFDRMISSPFAPFLIVIGIAGFYYILNKLLPEKPKYEPYHGMSTRRPLYGEYKLPQDVNDQLTKVLANVSPALQDLIPRRIDINLPFEVGIRRPQAVKALRLLFSTLLENVSVLDFLKTHSFYQDFKQRTKELGLVDDFDQPKHEYFFHIGKEEVQQEEDRRAEEFIENAITKLKNDFKSTSPENILEKIANKRAYIKKRGINRVKQIEFYEYYLLLKAYAYLKFQEKLQGVSFLSTEHKYLEALSLLEEFLRVGIGAELIALEQDVYLRDVLNKILNRELEDVRWQFNRLTAYQVKKERTSQAARDIQYSIVLSNRSTDDILRGIASGDCTAINGSAFYNTVPQFLFDPGFLNFKILQDDKWVGNVYTIVAEKDNNPVLIIDAVQLPVWGRTWPVSVRKLSDKVLEKVVEYAQEQGFAQVLMSSFVSNFNSIHEHFGVQYPTQAIEIEKIAGFEHLKALGLWDEYASRNEYMETFSPQWNYGLKRVDPNNPRQTLLLRRIWERSLSSQQPEEPTKASSPLKQNIVSRDTSGLFKFIQRNLSKAVFAAAFFIILALPHMANAAKFEIVPGQQPNQTQVVAVVEKGDNLWNIAGVAYKGVEGIGQGKYAAQAEWPKIYENEANQNQVLKGRQHKLGSQYPDTKQIVNILPGDTLVIPGSVNYEALGLKAPEVTSTQQEIQTEQAVKNLQQQKTQVEQELNQLQQQRQAVQVDLENLQRQKAELTRQILDLKKQLADIQEQLRQAKEKIPSGLQTEEAKRQALEVELKQLEQKKAQYTQDIANLERQYKEAQDDLSRIAAQKEKAGQELEQLRKQAPQAQTQIKDLQSEIQRLESQKKQNQQEVSQLQNQRDELQKGIEQLNKDKDKLQDELKDLKQQISDAKKILDEAKQKVQPTWENIWDGLSWLEKVGIILLGIGGIILLVRWLRFVHLQIKVERLRKEAQDLETKLGTYRAEEKDLIKMKQDAEKARIEVQEKANKVAAQQVQLEAERKQLEQESLNIEQQKQEIKKEKDALVELEGQRQAVRDEVKVLETQRDNLNQSLVQAQQKAQEAIRMAKEQEERIKAQTRLIQETLTEEQRQLQERLDAKRQEVSEQINVLDEQLRQARTKHELEMAGIGQERATVQAILEGLVSERDTVENRLREMGETIELLNRARDSLLDDLRDLDNQQKDLQLSIENLKKEKEKLEVGVEELKPVEEIKPEVEALVEEVIKVDEEANVLLGRIAPLSDEIIQRAVIGQIKDIGINNFSIESIPIKSSIGHNNIIVKIPASDFEYERLPKIILNAHTDTVRNNGYWFIFRGNKEHAESGALDDRAGVVATLQSLRMLKQKWEVEKIPHGPVWIVFTDLEESGFAGAEDLKDKYQGEQSKDNKNREYNDLFDNTYLIITVDGPLLYPPNPRMPIDNINPFVIAGKYDISDERYQAFEHAVFNLNHPNFHKPDCPSSDGAGDHHIFRGIKDKKTNNSLLVINLRAPHTDLHSPNETTYIEGQLVPMAQWISESVIELSKNLIPLQGALQTSAIAMRLKEGDQPKTIWEYKIKDGVPVPESYQLGPLSIAALNSLAETLVKLKSFYSKKDINKIKTIKIVTGNDRLAAVNREKGDIVLDINAFASDYLLLMEIEHELWHLILGSRGIFTEPAMEELTIVYLEILRFLSLTVEQQDEIIGALKVDNDIDDLQFYKLLTEAKDRKGSSESIIPNIINYLIRAKIPPTQFIENLKIGLRDKMELLAKYPTNDFHINSLVAINPEFKPFLRLAYYFEEMLEVEGLKGRAQKGEELGYAGEFVEGEIRQYYGLVGRNLFSFNPDDNEDVRLLGKIIDIFHNKSITDACLDSIRNWTGYGYATNAVADLFARLLVNINGVSAAERLKEFLNKRDENNNPFAIAVSELVLIRLDESTIPMLIAFLKNDNSFYMQRDIVISKLDKQNNVYLRSLYFQLINLLKDERIQTKEAALDLLGALHEKRIFREKGDGGSAKGQGMFAPEEHAEVNEVIAAAQLAGRGLLIWGDAQGWKQAKDGYIQDISWLISSLRRYPKLRITGLGVIDIPEVLAASNIVLIQPRNHSPPGLVVKSKDSYQIAHSGETFNSIYIDEKIYKQLYSFEIAVLLAHEAIELRAKRLARDKRILWTVDLAKQVHHLAEEYEIQIVGKSPNGRGSRFDDRIEEILDFANLSKKVQVQPKHEVINPEQKESQEAEILMPKQQEKQSAPQDIKPPTLEYPEARPEIIDNLRKLFLEGLFRNVSTNLPAKLDNFPLPLAQEIKQAYQLGKVKGMSLDADFLVALAVFFSKIFPNHANELVRYMKNLSIYLVDNTHSTYGATLSGNTFYIQKSCIEDLLGRPVTVEEIYQAIRNKDPRICVALFRIVIHEIGSAFFKLSHPANQELEKIFLAMLSKTKIELPPNIQQEINTINRTTNLDNVARIDWAQKRNKYLDVDYAKLNLGNLLSQDEIVSPVVTPLEQGISSPDKDDVATNPGGIDLSEIEITLKDEKFVSGLNPADLKILRAARALKEGRDSLAVLYVYEVKLLLKDDIIPEKEITQIALLQNLLSQLDINMRIR